MTVQLPETHSTDADIRAYAVGLVMGTVSPAQFGVLSPGTVIKNAEVIAQYIMNGPKEGV